MSKNHSSCCGLSRESTSPMSRGLTAGSTDLASPVDVMFFSYRSSDPWWQYLAESLTFTNATCVVSDMRGDGTTNIVDDFYTTLRQKDCSQHALQHLSKPTCDEIIRRCRVLRNQKKTTALAMIGAMWLTLDELLTQRKPRLIMSFIIDRYVLDVLDRVAQSHGIRFIGMTASIVPDQVMFMDRGKLIAVRKPDTDEVTQARQQIVNDTFTPSYVNISKKYNRRLYWRTFLLYKLRGVSYQFTRRIKRDKLNLHYLDALNHLDHKPRLGDYRVLDAFHQDWETRLAATPRDKRVFIGLQLLPEASLDYWLDDLSLLNNEELILDICQVLSNAGFTLFVKDHPLQFGFRKRDLIQRLQKIPAVVLVPYSVPATQLLMECDITATCTGTIGFQSAVAGACSIVSGAYYSDESHFIQFRNRADIAALPEKITEFQKNKTTGISDESIDSLLTNILAASAPGDLFSFKKFDKNQPQHVQRAATLVASLNRYLPQFLMDRAEEATAKSSLLNDFDIDFKRDQSAMRDVDF